VVAFGRRCLFSFLLEKYRLNKVESFTDTLTGLGSWQGLSSRLNSELFRLAAEQRDFRESFLCCDIDVFKSYVDVHGFAASDAALVELAQCLRESGHAIFRAGGDEFVVWGATSTLVGLMQHRGLIVRQTLVDVALPLDRARLHRCHSWILAHLRLGIVQPQAIGEAIRCVPPAEWGL
jgi:GGDEF domain-containing protein